ncbi:MAG: chloride channel protein [Planctomycetaceae bacterium]|jgi:CIC family chloride channel protein|nr:chloride channel protein [Planctomycetaceae bacterium]
MEGKHYHGQSFSQRLKQRFDWQSSGKMFVYCIAVGCITGLLTAGIYTGFQVVRSAVQSVYPAVGIKMPVADDYTSVKNQGTAEHVRNADTVPASSFIVRSPWEKTERHDVFGCIVLPRYWILIPLIPALGGLLCGFLMWSFAPAAAGEGTDYVSQAYHFRNALLRNRVPVTKTLTSFLTLGSGGSAGWEGPAALFGSWFASLVSYGAQLSVADRRTLLLAGAAGGVGAIFQIPAGGAFFVVEMLYASAALELSAILPCLLSSVVGYATFRYIHGEIFSIHLPETVGIHSPLDSLMLILFIPVIAAAGWLFVRFVMEIRNRIFRRMQIPEFFKPALGGFLLGCVALFFPQVLGGGYEWIPPLIHGQLPFLLIGLLILPKMLATALTVSSGGSGGLFAPSIFIGGLIGGTLGHLCQTAYPYFGIPTPPPDYTTCVLVGMSVFYAGVAKVPFGAAVIVCELAGFHYGILIPLIVLNLIHIAVQSPTASIFEEQVLAPIDSEAHFGNYSAELLQTLNAGSALELYMKNNAAPLTLSRHLTIPDAIRQIASVPDGSFPVLDESGRFIGIVHANDIWDEFQHYSKRHNKTVWDLTRTDTPLVTPKTDLYTAMRLCSLEQLTELPVTSPLEPAKLLGVLRQQDIITLYNQRLAAAAFP